jgi:nucleolar pre-ribosomal-associated protein 1
VPFLLSILSLTFSTPDKNREAYNNAFIRLLQDKLFECTLSELMLYLRVILFWSHHLLSSYTVKYSNTLERLCHLCFALVDCALLLLIVYLSVLKF